MLNGISRIAGAAVSAIASPSAANRTDARLRKPSSTDEVQSLDEYDFCGPTPEEVEAASKQLGSAFSDTKLEWREAVNSNSVEEVVITEVVSRANDGTEGEVIVRSEDQNSLAQRLEQQRSNAVVQCVDLFQRNPEVQAAVISLTRDPAVWNAFVRNDKVQELLRGNRHKRLAFNGAGSSLELLHDHTNPFIVAVHCLKSTVYEALDSIVDVVHSVFGFLDRKIFGGRESEPLDRPFKACMVLTILLISLVLLNRSSRP